MRAPLLLFPKISQFFGSPVWGKPLKCAPQRKTSAVSGEHSVVSQITEISFISFERNFVNFSNNQIARPKTALFGKRPQFAENFRLYEKG